MNTIIDQKEIAISLTSSDIERLRSSYLNPEIIKEAGIFRVESAEGARLVGRKISGGADYAGLIFPYYWPGESAPREYRLRRDNPEFEKKSDGSLKEKEKYLSPPGRSNLLYFSPSTPPKFLIDTSIPAAITEGEKKTLALSRFYQESGESRLVVGLGGVWNWRGKVGSQINGNGRKVPINGAIPDLDRIEWKGREALIIFDANVGANESVAAARRGLAAELKNKGAIVSLVDLPADLGINGIDDLLALKGPDCVRSYFANSAKYAKEEWDPPSAFNEYSLPKFPLESLPDFLRKYIEGLAEETQTPVDLAAMQSLGVMAAAVGGNVQIEGRPGWIQGLNLFFNSVLPSANRKSAVVAATIQPLEEVEAELIREKGPEIAEIAAEREAMNDRLNHLKKIAAKEKDENKRKQQIEEIKGLSREIAEKKIPIMPRLIADDITPEQLATLLADQDGRMALISAEGDIFDIMGGRYSNGSPNLGVFLKGHAGDTLRVDRRHRSEVVEQPALTIALSVQPDVIRGLIQKPAFRGRGLLGRFLYSIPESPLGHRKSKSIPLNPEAREQFRRRIKAMAALRKIEIEEGEWAPRLLRLSKEADDYLAAFQDEIEPLLAESGELGMMADWAGKLAGAVLRLSGILHLAEHANNYSNWPELVPAGTLKRAIELGRYFIPHAQAAYAEMGADPEIESAKFILRWIERNQLEEFNKREAFEGTKSRFKKVEGMEPALKLLEDQGYIRALAQAREGGRGRPKAQLFEVNPLFLDPSQKSQKSQKSEKSAILANSAISANSAKLQRIENSDQAEEELSL